MSPKQLQPGCFYGDLHSSFKVCGLGLADIVYPANQKTLEHTHELAYFSLTLKGTYTRFYGAQRVQCAPQTLIFHPPHQKQSGCCDEAGGRAFLVEIGPRLFEHVNRHPAITDRLAVFRNGPLIRSAIKLYKEFRQMDALSPLTIEGLLLEMLAEASRHLRNVHSDKRPLWLEQAKEIINAFFSDDLTISSIAESVGVHPVYLAAEFRRIYQTTIGEYMRKLRVDFACREIARTGVPLVQIALESGFSNQSQFCTTFKRVTGMTPAAYRAILR
jgi:AraC family transcriptional regulator